MNDISGESTEDEIVKIFSVLSRKDSRLILNLAAKGIDAPSDVLKKYKFSKKRYYTRLKELVDLKLVSKHKGVYRHTALGSLIFEHHLEGLRQILLNRDKIELLQRLKDSASNETRLAVEAISQEVLKELNSSLGLSGLKPIRLFTSWDELVVEMLPYVEELGLDMYLASRYMDFKALTCALKGASQGCKIHVIQSNLSTKLQILNNLITHEKPLQLFREIARNPNVCLMQADIPYSFIVIDRLHVGMEIVKPSDPRSFFLALLLQSPMLAQKLIQHFNEISKTADKHPLVRILGASTSTEDPAKNSYVNHQQ